MKTHYLISELAGLPGMPGSQQNARAKAQRENWPKRKAAGKGGGWEYPIIALPAETRAALADRLLKSVAGTAVATGVLPVSLSSAAPSPLSLVPLDRAGGTGGTPVVIASTVLKDWQRRAAEARAAICNEVTRCGAIMGLENAICKFVGLAAAGELPVEIQRLVPIANAKAGQDGKRAFSRRTLYNWLSDQRAGFAALAPKAVNAARIPEWAPALLSLWGQPQKPTLKDAVAKLPKLLPRGITPPSYASARRFLEKVGAVSKQHGRLLPREIKKIKPFVRRDVSDMLPTDCYTADGHTFDAEVAHPAHGQPFRPEITGMLDVATSKMVGWSVGLAESTWTVLDAWRHAVETHGISSIFYTDRGGGFKNMAVSDEVIGFASRLGTTPTNSLPYNSQARGKMERSHQTIWVKLARTLPTYIGEKVDPEFKQKIHKITRADVKRVGTSRMLTTWPEFIKLCTQAVADYNDTPHAALPKIRDEAGRLVHMTPNQAWDKAVAAGFEAHVISKAEADDLFRPYKECKCIRGEIRLFSNTYFSNELAEYHGETLRVGYDIHDASRIWVRDREGRLICIAEFEANKRAYFPKPFIQQAAEKRAEGRARRLETKLEEVRQELSPPLQIEHMPLETLPAVMPAALPVETNVVQLREPAAAARPMFYEDWEKYEWLQAHPEQATTDDGAWVDWFKSTELWRDLYGPPQVFRAAGD